MSNEITHAQARAIYEAGLKRVATLPPPAGQKYQPGTRVKIDDSLGLSMRHFPSGVNATVLYTGAHAYGGADVKSYCLDVDGHGLIAWYYEHQLSPI